MEPIVLKRVKFLQLYVRMKHENVRQFVFLDETWVFQDETIRKSWQNESIKITKSSKVGGRRYIVLNAGNSIGFIPGAKLIFPTNNHHLFYHGDMNRGNSLYWFEHQLLIRLKEPSIIVWIMPVTIVLLKTKVQQRRPLKLKFRHGSSIITLTMK